MRTIKDLYREVQSSLEKKGYALKRSFGGTLVLERADENRTQSIQISRRTKTKYSGEIRHHQFIGFSVSLSVSTLLKTRLGMSKKGLALSRFADRLAKLFKLTTFEAPNELVLRTRDEPWARRLSESDFFIEFTKDFFQGELAPAQTVSLSFSPNLITLLCRVPELGTERVQLISDFSERLAAFAKKAEELPPPTKQFEQNAIERIGSKSPFLMAFLFLGAGLLFFFVLGLLMVGLLFLVTKLL